MRVNSIDDDVIAADAAAGPASRAIAVTRVWQ